jgi:hypothetical protein
VQTGFFIKMMLENKGNSYSETEMGEILISPPLSHPEKDFLLKFLNKFHSLDKYQIDQGIYDLEKKKLTTDSPKKISVEENISNIMSNAINDIHTDILISFSSPEKLTPSLFTPFELSFSSKDQFTDCLIIKKKHSQKVDSAKWLVFLIEHFFKKDCIAKILYPKKFQFLKEHSLNGSLWYKIVGDVVKIEVKNNIVTSFNLELPENILKLFAGTKDEYKQYSKITIQELAENPKFSSEKIIHFSKSKLLDKLVLNAQLNKDLKINEGTEKTIKV